MERYGFADNAKRTGASSAGDRGCHDSFRHREIEVRKRKLPWDEDTMIEKQNYIMKTLLKCWQWRLSLGYKAAESENAVGKSLCPMHLTTVTRLNMSIHHHLMAFFGNSQIGKYEDIFPRILCQLSLERTVLEKSSRSPTLALDWSEERALDSPSASPS